MKSRDDFNSKRQVLSGILDEIASAEFYEDPTSTIEPLYEARDKLTKELDQLDPAWRLREASELEEAIQKIQQDLLDNKSNNTFSRTVSFKGKKYFLTYDEDRVLDTVKNENGELMVSTHHVVKRIATNADRIFNMETPKGFDRVY